MASGKFRFAEAKPDSPKWPLLSPNSFYSGLYARKLYRNGSVLKIIMSTYLPLMIHIYLFMLFYRSHKLWAGSFYSAVSLAIPILYYYYNLYPASSSRINPASP